MTLSKLSDLKDFKTSITQYKPKIGRLGGISYQRYVAGKEENVKLKEIVFALDKLLTKNPHLRNDAKNLRKVIRKIRLLDQQGNDKLSSKSLHIKGLTRIRQIVGNLFKPKKAILDKIDYSGKIPATSKGAYRTLLLKGDQGSVACRVRGISNKTIPRISKGKRLEFSLRAQLRMKNLIAVRGEKEGARMVGPCDYYGNLENPHQTEYTIQIDKGIPVFLKEKSINRATVKKPTVPSSCSNVVDVKWHKGTDPKINKIKKRYEAKRNPVVGKSLFPNSGILEIDGDKEIKLPSFNAKKYDLSSFGARLVKNNIPFKITDDKLSSPDEYRAVSYLYESDYASEQVKNGGGLFLERHEFAQTITPLDKNSKGFVTLARFVGSTQKQLEIIAVEIPYGYTLIIDKHCIHGDTNLDGMFMMCMTSNHVTMQTADTVFLKSPAKRENINIVIDSSKTSSKKKTPLKPIVTFHNSPQKSFKREVDQHNPITDPLRINKVLGHEIFSKFPF